LSVEIKFQKIKKQKKKMSVLSVRNLIS